MQPLELWGDCLPIYIQGPGRSPSIAVENLEMTSCSPIAILNVMSMVRMKGASVVSLGWWWYSSPIF